MRACIFPSDLTRRERRVYGAVGVVAFLVFGAMLWPVAAWFSRIRPMVLGMPFSLFYLATLLTCNFVMLWALFRWEGRHRSAPDEGDRDRAAAREERGGGAAR